MRVRRIWAGMRILVGAWFASRHARESAAIKRNEVPVTLVPKCWASDAGLSLNSGSPANTDRGMQSTSEGDGPTLRIDTRSIVHGGPNGASRIA